MIEKAVLEKQLRVLSVKGGLFNRLKFELTAKSYFKKNEVCFTFFGPPILSLIGFTHNINGFAYSNLLYPEIEFWWFQSRIKRIRSHLIDWYRKYSMSFANEIIYETEVLRNRALFDFRLKNVKSHVVKMSTSSLVGPDKVDPLDNKFHQLTKINGFKLLFLAGAQPNKRIKEFLKILVALNQQSDSGFYIILTMSIDENYYKLIMECATNLGVGEFIINLGTVKPHDVSTLIHHCDSMMNFALLESFSNNFIEAWCMQKPLIVSDSDWARECCGNGALYVDINDVAEGANKIFQLLMNPKTQIENGTLQLSLYPTTSEKNLNYLNITAAAQ